MLNIKAIGACFLIALSGHAGVITPLLESRATTERPLLYLNAHRIIGLVDGSQVLLLNRPAPKEPIAIDGMFISSKGSAYDVSLRVVHWIPNELAPETSGQIYSAAMSDDQQWLTVTGGWMGRDGRGHNGVFVLRREPVPNFDNWHLKSWFDVRGMTISEIQFGPDDTVITTSQEDKPDGGAAPLITVFTFAGQKLGSFISVEKHGAPGSAGMSRLTRIEKIGSSSFAIYDPEKALVRYVAISSTAGRVDVRQTGSVSLSFPERKSNVVAFDALPDGHVAVARTVIQEDRRSYTLVSALSPDGRVIDEWRSPRVWRYGYVQDHTFRGFYPAADEAATVISSVSIK